MADLLGYREKQGYASKFGAVKNVVTQKAKSVFTRKKDVPSKRPVPKPREKPTLPALPKAPVPKHCNTPVVPLWIYADDEENVKKAVDVIYSQYKHKCDEKSLRDETLKNWTPKQMDSVHDVEKKFSVEITFPESDCMKICGLKESVMDAYGEILQKVRNIEREQKEKEYADQVQRLVQWYYVDITEEGDEKMVAYQKDVNLKLERAYTKDKLLKWKHQGYVFDFEKWVEYPDDDEQDQATMIRKDKIEAASSNLPTDWVAMDKDVHLHQLNKGSNEFTSVAANFEKSLAQGNMTCRINRIDRVQSKTLYQQYTAKKTQLEKQNPGVQVQKTLWHGTKKDSTMSISSYGFNRSYCDSENNKLGEGAYFTTNATYASRDRYAPADQQGRRYMFQCMVLTGDFTTGASGMRVPPPKDPANPQFLFDSVVDDPANPQIFVIFSDTQAYPEYLISFQS